MKKKLLGIGLTTAIAAAATVTGIVAYHEIKNIHNDKEESTLMNPFEVSQTNNEDSKDIYENEGSAIITDASLFDFSTIAEEDDLFASLRRIGRLDWHTFGESYSSDLFNPWEPSEDWSPRTVIEQFVGLDYHNPNYKALIEETSLEGVKLTADAVEGILLNEQNDEFAFVMNLFDQDIFSFIFAFSKNIFHNIIMEQSEFDKLVSDLRLLGIEQGVPNMLLKIALEDSELDTSYNFEDLLRDNIVII